MLFFKLLVLIVAIVLGAYVCKEGKSLKVFRVSSKIISLWVVIVLASELLNNHSWETTIMTSVIFLTTLVVALIYERLLKAEIERDYLKSIMDILKGTSLKEE